MTTRLGAGISKRFFTVHSQEYFSELFSVSVPKSWSVLGEVLWATVRAGPARDELDPENAARDAGVDGGASLRSVLRVQARSAVPVVQATNQIEAWWGSNQWDAGICFVAKTKNV